MPLRSSPKAEAVFPSDRPPVTFQKQLERAAKQQVGLIVLSPLLSVTLAVQTPTTPIEQWHSAGAATVVRSSPSDANLDVVLERVTSLVQEAEEDEVVPPSDHAVTETCRLLRAAFPLVRSAFPKASATSDGRGWIHLYWRKPERMVQLTVTGDPNQPAYIYHSAGDDYRTERDVTPRRLAYWLDWFADA